MKNITLSVLAVIALSIVSCGTSRYTANNNGGYVNSLYYTSNNTNGYSIAESPDVNELKTKTYTIVNKAGRYNNYVDTIYIRSENLEDSEIASANYTYNVNDESYEDRLRKFDSPTYVININVETPSYFNYWNNPWWYSYNYRWHRPYYSWYVGWGYDYYWRYNYWYWDPFYRYDYWGPVYGWYPHWRYTWYPPIYHRPHWGKPARTYHYGRRDAIDSRRGIRGSYANPARENRSSVTGNRNNGNRNTITPGSSASSTRRNNITNMGNVRGYNPGVSSTKNDNSDNKRVNNPSGTSGVRRPAYTTPKSNSGVTTSPSRDNSRSSVRRTSTSTRSYNTNSTNSSRRNTSYSNSSESRSSSSRSGSSSTSSSRSGSSSGSSRSGGGSNSSTRR